MNYLIEVGDSGDLEDDIQPWNSGADETKQQEPVISDQLDCEQKAELADILQEFAKVLKSVPRRTGLVDHWIETEASGLLRQPPYRLPHAHREAVLKELGEIGASGNTSSRAVGSPDCHCTEERRKDTSLCGLLMIELSHPRECISDAPYR